MLEMAGIPVPQHYQGESLLPFVKGKKGGFNRNTILIEHLWDYPQIPSSEGVRSDRWKYFRYRFIDAPEELYDLKNDPLETRNLASLPKYADVLAELRKNCEASAKKYSARKLCPDDPFMKVQNF
jgi:arylsulfatase A-like enzyme